VSATGKARRGGECCIARSDTITSSAPTCLTLYGSRWGRLGCKRKAAANALAPRSRTRGGSPGLEGSRRGCPLLDVDRSRGRPRSRCPRIGLLRSFALNDGPSVTSVPDDAKAWLVLDGDVPRVEPLGHAHLVLCETALSEERASLFEAFRAVDRRSGPVADGSQAIQSGAQLWGSSHHANPSSPFSPAEGWRKCPRRRRRPGLIASRRVSGFGCAEAMTTSRGFVANGGRSCRDGQSSPRQRMLLPADSPRPPAGSAAPRRAEAERTGTVRCP
jgi:hypothetical protein